MVPILSSIAQRFFYVRRVRKELDKTIVKPKVHLFARIGSKFPGGRTATTREDVLKNLAYVQRDLVRYDRSIAIVHDHTRPFTPVLDSMITPWKLVAKVLTDDNASVINVILVDVLDDLADTACAVVRNRTVYNEILAAILLAFAKACEALEPFCIEGEDALAIRAANYAQKLRLRNLLETKAGSRVPWSIAEMDKYIYKVEMEIFAGTTWGQGDASEETETAVKDA